MRSDMKIMKVDLIELENILCDLVLSILIYIFKKIFFCYNNIYTKNKLTKNATVPPNK